MIRAFSFILLFVILLSASAAQAATQPAQPPTGPGGAECLHQGMRSQSYGEGAQAYWLFEPARPAALSAPVIAFNHGWSAMDPKTYGAWIEHLAKRGNIVIYPVYQDSLRTPVDEFTGNAAAAIRAAIQRLQTEPGHAKPDLGKFALAGHSMGGVISANLAATWKESGLPQPRAVLCVEPGKTWGPATKANIMPADLSRIPKETLLLAVVGDSDEIARDIDAKRIFRESTQIPVENKNYITMMSDDHGTPPLRATHMAPVAFGGDFDAGERRGPLRDMLRERARGLGSATLDALDYYGTWKLLDALTDAAFYGKNRNYALGNTPEQRFMGLWSDGVPVKPLQISTTP